MKLVLASSSPRRREILALLGLPFEVIAPEFDEIVSPGRAPAEEVLDFAIGKAAAVRRQRPDSLIIGSDTMVVIDGVKLGKPADLADARRMLRALAGRTHRIYTGVAILDPANRPGLRHVEEVSVTMRALGDADIEGYLAFRESMDKAGAYSIQGEGRRLIEQIRGDYLAAVGMPLKQIAEYLNRRGVSFPLDIERLYNEESISELGRFLNRA